VGGLSLALALREAGFRDIHVYERGAPGDAPDLGLVLPPSANKVLHALGLKDALHELRGYPQGQLQRTWQSGFLLSQRPLGQFAEARYGAPHCVIDHATLLLALLDACARHAITIVGNSGCTGMSQYDDRVDVQLGGAQASHDVLIGCDGRSSTVRRHLHYPVDGIRSRSTAWSGSASVDALPRPLVANAITTWLGPGQFLTHWLAADGARVEFMAIVNDAAADDQPATGTPTPHFGSAHPHLRALVESSDSLVAEPVTEHEPIAQWYDRRVVLLGDACHALPPHLQQGAALAIEDAWVLSRMLERWEDEPTSGFDEYQRYRKVRVTRVRQASRSLATQWTLDAPRQVLARNLKLSLASRFLPEIAMQQLDWLYGYDCIKGFE
jgi:salicylate hydroxylase